MSRFVEYKPVISNGIIIEGYFVNGYGEFISTKSGTNKTLKVSYCDRNSTNPYPKIRFYHKGNSITRLVHRLVCETWNEIPMPEELKDINWENIPHKERTILLNYLHHCDRYQVNHIDHDIYNFRADNLEWVSAKENQRKYQKSRQIFASNFCIK